MTSNQKETAFKLKTLNAFNIDMNAGSATGITQRLIECLIYQNKGNKKDVRYALSAPGYRTIADELSWMMSIKNNSIVTSRTIQIQSAKIHYEESSLRIKGMLKDGTRDFSFEQPFSFIATFGPLKDSFDNVDTLPRIFYNNCKIDTDRLRDLLIEEPESLARFVSAKVQRVIKDKNLKVVSVDTYLAANKIILTVVERFLRYGMPTIQPHRFELIPE